MEVSPPFLLLVRLQVPQYILADCAARREHCNIIVTQPRRIAAMSVAGRVADEMKCQPGTLCGFQVRSLNEF